MFKIGLLCISVLFATLVCEGCKVLVLFPHPAKSHSILGDGVVRHLLKAGHEVTYITPYPNAREQHQSLREIDISSVLKVFPETMFNIENLLKKKVNIKGLSPFVPMLLQTQVAILEHEAVKKLLSDSEEKFDVLIHEWMLVDLTCGIAAVFKCPFIWVSAIDPHWMVLKLIDGIPNPAYIPSPISSNVMPFSFIQRVEELFNIILGLTLQYFNIIGTEHKEYERLLAPVIRRRGHKVPDFEQVRYNGSLILGNSYVSMGYPTRLPQSYKVIGGYHIDTDVQPLQEDLKALVDNAEHGLIYFSMGSQLGSKHTPEEIKTSLLKMFGKLKQTVIWKFEEDLLNRPSNVHIVQWVPQQSVLAHPNCILFITHGGLLSTTEAIHFGKPMIGIPVFGDQFNNVDRFVKRGVAKRVDLSYNMADDLEIAINDLLTDPSYSTKVKELSYIYHDRPVSPGKELVHWVEHVVRTGGAPHLRSPALMVPWYQKCYLDLAVVIVGVLFILKLVIMKLIGILLLSKKEQRRKI